MLFDFYLNFLDFGLENMVAIGRSQNLGVSWKKQAFYSHHGVVFLGQGVFHHQRAHFPGSPSPS